MPNGEVVPVTAVVAGPCFITQVKNKERDGYKAVQVGCGSKKKLNKSIAGHLKGLDNLRYLSEFIVPEDDKNIYEKGQKITVAVFVKGDIAEVIGTSKGKGFQGVVKRHGFHGADKTHGTKDQLRHSGSVGPKGPAHTFKGTRMGGRMGGQQVTVKNLEIVDIDDKNNLMFIKGAIPGSRNSLIKIIAPGEMKLAKEEAEPSKRATEEVRAEVKEEIKKEENK